MRRAGRVSIVLLLAVAARAGRGTAPVLPAVVRRRHRARDRGLRRPRQAGRGPARAHRRRRRGLRSRRAAGGRVARVRRADRAGRRRGSRRDPRGGFLAVAFDRLGPPAASFARETDARLPRASAAPAVLDGRLLDRPRPQHAPAVHGRPRRLARGAGPFAGAGLVRGRARPRQGAKGLGRAGQRLRPVARGLRRVRGRARVPGRRRRRHAPAEDPRQPAWWRASTRSSATSRATPPRTRSSRSSDHWRPCPAARPSCSSRKVSPCPPTSRRPSWPSSPPPTAPTSASTPRTRCGLRAASTSDETRRAIASLRTRLDLQQGMGNPAARGAAAQEDPTSGLALLERNEDTLRLAPGSGLGRLADLTGGFLIAGHQRPVGRPGGDGRGAGRLLPALVFAEEHGLRRALPPDHGQGTAAARAAAGPQGLPGGPDAAARAGSRLRGPRARAARSAAAADGRRTPRGRTAVPRRAAAGCRPRDRGRARRRRPGPDDRRPRPRRIGRGRGEDEPALCRRARAGAVLPRGEPGARRLYARGRRLRRALGRRGHGHGHAGRAGRLVRGRAARQQPDGGRWRGEAGHGRRLGATARSPTATSSSTPTSASRVRPRPGVPSPSS